jgi:hypothetical protein
MPDWISRVFSIDDLWSVVGYGLILSVNQLTRNPMPFSDISLLASGMLAIVWLLSGAIRARNEQHSPNVRVVLWAAIAVASAAMGLLT